MPYVASIGRTTRPEGGRLHGFGRACGVNVSRRDGVTGAYPWRSLLDSGAVVTNGTDAPVEDVDPIPSLYASVTRKLADGTAFFPKQRMTRAEALKSYTIDAAFAGFEEDRKGSLKVGKLGDITVLSKDFLIAADEEIRKMEVLYTIIGGKVVYQRR